MVNFWREYGWVSYVYIGNENIRYDDDNDGNVNDDDRGGGRGGGG